MGNALALPVDRQISPPVFIPKGDCINDAMQIRFVVFKVEASPVRMRIFDLAGGRWPN